MERYTYRVRAEADSLREKVAASCDTLASLLEEESSQVPEEVRDQAVEEITLATVMAELLVDVVHDARDARRKLERNDEMAYPAPSGPILAHLVAPAFKMRETKRTDEWIAEDEELQEMTDLLTSSLDRLETLIVAARAHTPDRV